MPPLEPQVSRQVQVLISSKILISEVGFLMLAGSQIFVILGFIILAFVSPDHELTDYILKCLVTLTHSIFTPTVIALFTIIEIASDPRTREDRNVQVVNSKYNVIIWSGFNFGKMSKIFLIT